MHRRKIQQQMEMNAELDLSGLIELLIALSRIVKDLRTVQTASIIQHRNIFSIIIRFNSPETPVHLDSPDTPYIGRKAFYPNGNFNNEHDTNNVDSTENRSRPSDSTENPSLNENQQHQRNHFNRQGHRQNGQRRQDRHHG